MLVKKPLKIFCAACLQWQSRFKQCTASISHSSAAQTRIDYFPHYFKCFE